MKKSRSKFLKIVDEKHDINFHWPYYAVCISAACISSKDYKGPRFDPCGTNRMPF